MFVLYAVAAGLVLGLLAGGRVERMAAVHLRWWPLALGGLVVQLVLFSPLGEALAGVTASVLYTLSTCVVFAVVLRNIGLAGLPLIALGAGLNLAAIVANGGRMPSDPGALAAAGRSADAGAVSNGSVTSHPLLAPLTDIFAIPAGIPLANVFSIGDVLIGVGLAIAIAVLMRSGVRQAAVKSAVRRSDGGA